MTGERLADLELGALEAEDHRDAVQLWYYPEGGYVSLDRQQAERLRDWLSAWLKARQAR
jgi:hypothetical protein